MTTIIMFSFAASVGLMYYLVEKFYDRYLRIRALAVVRYNGDPRNTVTILHLSTYIVSSRLRYRYANYQKALIDCSNYVKDHPSEEDLRILHSNIFIDLVK